MAIVHFRAQIIGGHRSAVAAAAYRHRTTMFDKASDRSWSYTPDAHLVHSEIALPDNAPAWIARLGVAPDVLSAELWNAATLAETRCDAQIAREFVIALPAELTRAQNIQLVRDYVATELSTRGFASDWVYHDNPGNPHVHLMHTMRPLRDSGFGPKATPARDTLGKPLLRANGKPLYTRFAGTPDDYRALRVSWVGHANRALAAAGHSTVLDARSYA